MQVYCYRKGEQAVDEDKEKMDASKLVPGDYSVCIGY